MPHCEAEMGKVLMHGPPPVAITKMTRFLSKGEGRHRPLALFRYLTIGVLKACGVRSLPAIPDDARDAVTRAVALYGQAVAGAPFEDLLGPVYLKLAASMGVLDENVRFTPQADADTMVQAMLPPKEAYTAQPQLHMLEPTCGSGVVVLAMLKAVAARDGLDALSRWSFTLVDINADCAYMAAAQVLANLRLQTASVGELLVYRGNALELGLVTDPEVVAHVCAESQSPVEATNMRRLDEIRTASRGYMMVTEPANLESYDDNTPIAALRKAS